jgi:hypothetical protein
MFTRKFLSATILTVGIGLSATGAQAQGTFADKAIKQLEGTWITGDGSRIIEFSIKENTPRFDDTVTPGVKMSGSYGPGDRGAAYVLEYPKSLQCYYNVSFPSQEKGNEMIMSLVRVNPKDLAHQCIVGTLKRSR